MSKTIMGSQKGMGGAEAEPHERQQSEQEGGEQRNA